MRVSTSSARYDFSTIISRVVDDKKRVHIYKGREGEDVAAIIPIEDLLLLEQLIREKEDLIDTIESEKAQAEEEAFRT